jgi:D-alanine-D-alanine ligase
VRIAVIYNEPRRTPAEGTGLANSNDCNRTGTADLRDAADFGVLGEVQLIAASLADAGHEPLLFAADDAAALCAFLSTQRPELIFNCCESFAGRAALEMNVAALFELFGIPCTGSSALTLGLTLNKALTKDVLSAHGIQTPAHVVVGPGQDPAAAHRLGFPLIVKPVAEDASIGIDDAAVVNDAVALAERVRFVWREFGQAALVEEFIAGREFNVSVLATSPTEFVALPIGEISFAGLAEGRPQIFGYEAKWDAGSASYKGTVPRCPATIDEGTADRIRRVALAAARAVGLRDYGRIDLRLRHDDQALFVLEVNANPDLNDDAGFLRAARASGRTCQSTVCEILDQAFGRNGRVRSEASSSSSWR